MIRAAAATDAGGPPHGGGRRSWLRTWGALAGSAVLLGVIVWKSDPVRLAAVLRGTQPAMALLALSTAGGALALLALRWHWMLQLRQVADRYRDSARTTLIGYGLTMVLPGAIVADVAKSYSHSRRQGRPLDEVLLACGLDRFTGLIGLAGYAVLIVLVAVPQSGGRLSLAPFPGTPMAVGKVLLVAALLGGLGWAVARHPRVRAGLQRGRRLMHHGFGSLRDRPRLLVSAAILSVLGNVLVASTLALGLGSVAPDPLPWSRLLWTLPVIGLAAAFSLTVAGAGAREGAAVALWSACGIPAPVAVAACLVTLAVNMSWAAVGGLLLAGAPVGRQGTGSATSRADAPAPVGLDPDSSGRQ